MRTLKEVYCEHRAEAISEYNGISYSEAYHLAEIEYAKMQKTVKKAPVDEQLFEDLLMEQQEQM